MLHKFISDADVIEVHTAQEISIAKMRGAGWCRQLSANLQRNLILKWRKKWDIAKVTNAWNNQEDLK